MAVPELDELVSLKQFEPHAQSALEAGVWDYVDGGAADERTLRRNPKAWQKIKLLPRVLADATSIDTSVDLLGLALPHPILLAPTARHRSYSAQGEIDTLAGACASGALYVQSSLGTTALEDVASAARGQDWWFQLYIQRDRGFTEALVATAIEGGASALVVTVDTPTLGARDRDKRDSFGLKDGQPYPILEGTPLSFEEGPVHQRIYNPLLAPDITWNDFEWLVQTSSIPVIPKGVLRADDARRAVDAGAAAISVSNHGARNLDTTVTTAEALPAVIDAVGGDVPVIVDGGIRRGTDVAKALALGAGAVMIGRPYIWGLATHGAEGVQRVVEILHTELRMAMALLGANTVEELTPDLLA